MLPTFVVEVENDQCLQYDDTTGEVMKTQCNTNNVNQQYFYDSERKQLKVAVKNSMCLDSSNMSLKECVSTPPLAEPVLSSANALLDKISTDAIGTETMKAQILSLSNQIAMYKEDADNAAAYPDVENIKIKLQAEKQKQNKIKSDMFSEYQQILDSSTMEDNERKQQMTMTTSQEQAQQQSRKRAELLEDDMQTMERHIEIGIDEGIRKERSIFVMKFTLIMASIAVAVGLMALIGLLSQTYMVRLTACSGIVWLVFIVYHHLQNRNRSSTKQQVLNFPNAEKLVDKDGLSYKNPSCFNKI